MVREKELLDFSQEEFGKIVFLRCNINGCCKLAKYVMKPNPSLYFEHQWMRICEDHYLKLKKEKNCNGRKKD